MFKMKKTKVYSKRCFKSMKKIIKYFLFIIKNSNKYLQAEKKENWPELESNQRHKDFQSSALPTELSGQ